MIRSHLGLLDHRHYLLVRLPLCCQTPRLLPPDRKSPSRPLTLPDRAVPPFPPVPLLPGHRTHRLTPEFRPDLAVLVLQPVLVLPGILKGRLAQRCLWPRRCPLAPQPQAAQPLLTVRRHPLDPFLR